VGITLGAVIGRLLAQTMMTGKRMEQLEPFDPIRLSAAMKKCP
jgi:D-amino-acid dehydrogenase